MNTWTTCAAEYRRMAGLSTYSLAHASKPSLPPQRLRLTANIVQDRQTMYVQCNTEQRSCKPLLQYKSNTYYTLWVCVCVCSFNYPACNAHAPYCHLVACPALPYFSTLPNRRNDFREKLTEHKTRVLIFSTTFVWNISHSKKNWARYDQKCISVWM